MKLGEEIIALFGGEDPSRVTYTVTGGRGGYFRNVKRLLEFSSARIVLRGRKGKVTVEGKNLSLAKYVSADIAILGEISSVVCEE